MALDPTPLGRAATVVRNRRDVGDGGDLQPRGLERPDGLLPTRTGTLDVDLDLAHAVLHGLARGRLGRERGRVRRALARALEPGDAGRAPAHDGPGEVRDGDDRVVE